MTKEVFTATEENTLNCANDAKHLFISIAIVFASVFVLIASLSTGGLIFQEGVNYSDFSRELLGALVFSVLASLIICPEMDDFFKKKKRKA